MTVSESAEMSVGIAASVVVAIMIPVVVPTVEAITMTLWRIGFVEVVSGIEAIAPVVVTSAEAHVDCRAMHVHPAMAVAVVDGEGPGTCMPCKGTIEPAACHVAIILPGGEDVAEIAVADIPPEP